MKVLALAAYPVRGASTRFRVGQYIAPLAARGIEVTLATHLDDAGFRVLYAPGSTFAKARALAVGALREALTALTADADVVWVQREAGLVGPEILERLLSLGRPLVLDVDDAIWLAPPDEGAKNPGWARRLRSTRKADRLLALAREVIVGSSHLAEHAAKFARNVTVVPTVVSREEWSPSPSASLRFAVPSPARGEGLAAPSPLAGEGSVERSETQGEGVRIGWIGSHSTAPFLQTIVPVLRELGVHFHTIGGDAGYGTSEPFDLDREVEQARALDVGVAPMPANAWTDGKCGFKQLQYMALGLPCVTSPWAGMRDFIVEGENALVCRDLAEWKAALTRVINDAALRDQLGRNGRALVESRLCAEVQVDRIAQVLMRAKSSA